MIVYNHVFWTGFDVLINTSKMYFNRMVFWSIYGPCEYKVSDDIVSFKAVDLLKVWEMKLPNISKSNLD